MATLIPLCAPRFFVIGSTLQWRVLDSDYPPSTWSATVVFVSSSDQQSKAGSDYGDGSHLLELTPAESALFEAGMYRFQVNVTDGTDRFTIAQGVIEARPDYAEISGGIDDRSSPARIFDAITAMLERKATHDQSSLAVGGRSLSRYSWDELVRMRGHFAHQLDDEERAARGFAPKRNTQIRFTR